MSFGNGALLPSETGIDADGRSMTRRIKMHEFLMTGGIKVGEREGRTTYSDPIKHTDPAWETTCPWHGAQDGDCNAWLEIVAGRGYWSRLSVELAALEAELEDTKREDFDALAEQAQTLRNTLALQPRDAKALRDRTPEIIAEERAHSVRAKARRTASLKSATAAAAKIAEGLTHAPNWRVATKNGFTVYCTDHKPTAHEDETWTRIPAGRSECIECAFDAAPAKAPVYAAAGPKKGGNPWDKMSADAFTPVEPRVDYKTGEILEDDWWNEGPSAPVVQEPDSRDEAFAAFAAVGVPDAIEIDGDEDEDDEPVSETDSSTEKGN